MSLVVVVVVDSRGGRSCLSLVVVVVDRWSLVVVVVVAVVVADVPKPLIGCLHKLDNESPTILHPMSINDRPPTVTPFPPLLPSSISATRLLTIPTPMPIPPYPTSLSPMPAPPSMPAPPLPISLACLPPTHLTSAQVLSMQRNFGNSQRLFSILVRETFVRVAVCVAVCGGGSVCMCECMIGECMGA